MPNQLELTERRLWNILFYLRFNQLLFNFFIHFPRSFSQQSCLLSSLRSSAYIAKPEPKGHNYVNEKRFDQDDKTQRKKRKPYYTT